MILENLQKGILIVDTLAIRENEKENLKSIFGADLTFEDGSLSSALLDLLTKKEVELQEAIAFTLNQFNPTFASGFGADFIASFTETKRRLATASRVYATLSGVTGTVVSAGSRTKDTNNNIWILQSDVTIPNDGLFICETLGAVSLEAGELDTIVDDVLGWETVLNSNSAEVGRNKEDDIDLNNKRYAEINKHSLGTIDSIKAGLYGVKNVKSFKLLENKTKLQIIKDNVTLEPNSIYACIDGGLDEDIAKVFRHNKDLGCAYNNGASSEPKDITITFIDSFGDVVNYDVKFDRPDIVAIKIKVDVEIKRGQLSPIDAIKDDVMDYALDNFKVGSNVSPYEIVSSIAKSDNYFVSSCEICLNDGLNNWQKETLVLEVWELALTSKNLIEVNITND